MDKIVHIKTFGCQMNERDSEIMGQLLSRSGYIRSDEPEAADLILVNYVILKQKKVISVSVSAAVSPSRKAGRLLSACPM